VRSSLLVAGTVVLMTVAAGTARLPRPATSAPAAPVRGAAGDLWADVILGQRDFTEVTPNRVTANRLFNPNGVLVDRTVTPNRVYVYDAGNNRVLGFDRLGGCTAGSQSGAACTSDSDCAGGTCRLNPDQPAAIVLGQPAATDHSACNGDSGFQGHPVPAAASARSLCLLRVDQLSILEGGSAATMAVDAEGNLYVPDFFNRRVLRYDRPFATDAVADHVWGQPDFGAHDCNRGRGYAGPADAASLCLAPPNGQGTIEAGVAVDGGGNLWVTDKLNHRVLRFPRGPDGVPAATADLVLGQPDFASHSSGGGLAQANAPGSVRVDARGVVYVADSYNDRLLAYAPPLSSGMPASYTLGQNLYRPMGLEIGPDGDLWVNDAFNHRLLRFRDRTQVAVHTSYTSGDWGAPGVDRDGNILQSGWTYQSLVHHRAPGLTDPGLVPDAFLAASARNPRFANEVDGAHFYVVNGMTVAGDQLVVADQDRLLYWNEPWAAASDQPADGVVGQRGDPASQTKGRGGYFGRPEPDHAGRLWVSHSGADISAYHLPLDGADPVQLLRSPLPLAGGGTFAWTDSLAIGDLAADPATDALWASDRDYNRVFRINHLGEVPTVDVVLGQANAAGASCNRGRGQGAPSQDSLCAPGGLAFDSHGNLFVADHTREFDGNHRLLMWAAGSLPVTASPAVFGVPATRVFGRGGSFTATACSSPLCAPFDPIFGPGGQMVVAVNPYLNGLDGGRFPLVFNDILANDVPDDTLGDYFSMSLQGAFDRLGNLYMSDHNRSRVLVYRAPFGGSGPNATATRPATAVPSSPTPSRTPIPGRTPTPSPTPSPAGAPFCDPFDRPALRPGWRWTDPLGDSAYSLVERPGWLRLRTSGYGHDLYMNTDAPRLLQFAGTTSFTVATHLDLHCQNTSYQGAGLLVWQDADNYLRLERECLNGDLHVFQRLGGAYTQLPDPPTGLPANLWLRLRRAGDQLVASYSLDGSTWRSRGTVRLPFATAVQVGVAVLNEWQDGTVTADFADFTTDRCPHPVYMPRAVKSVRSGR
jgi:regulation of enolase protein 1 (concanavalin A-like superfamily)/sugar lactone lactonase YvrE